MKNIKKFIKKNQLKRDLRKIEDELIQKGYYTEMEKLNKLIYQPDNYASLLFKIKRKYCPLLSRKEYIEKQIRELSDKQTSNNTSNELTK